MAEEFTDFIRYFGASVELTCFHQRAVTCVKFGVQSSKEKYIQASENPNYLTEVAELKVQWIFKGSEGDPQSCYYSFVFQNIEYAFSCFLQNEVSIDSTHTININPSNPCEHSWTLRCDTYPTRFIGSYHISQKKMYEAIGDGDWPLAMIKAKEILTVHNAFIPSLISTCVEGTGNTDWMRIETKSSAAQASELCHLLEVLIYNALFGARRTPEHIQKALVKTFGKYSINRFHHCLNFWFLLDLWGDKRASSYLVALKDMSLLDKSKEDDFLITTAFGRISFGSTFVGLKLLNDKMQARGLSSTNKINFNKWLIEKLSEVASNLSHPQWKGQFQGLDLADKALGHPLQINKLVERAESEQNIAEDKRRAKILQEEIDEIRFRESEDPCRVEIVSRSKGTSQSIGEYKIDILKKR